MRQTLHFIINPIPPVLSKACQVSSLKDKPSENYLRLVELIQKSPKKAVLEFEALPKPLSAPLSNLYAYALIKRKKHKKAELLIKENSKNFPLHLQSQINYADLALRKKNTKKSPKFLNRLILQKLLQIKQFFPSQNLEVLCL